MNLHDDNVNTTTAYGFSGPYVDVTVNCPYCGSCAVSIKVWMRTDTNAIESVVHDSSAYCNHCKRFFPFGVSGEMSEVEFDLINGEVRGE